MDKFLCARANLADSRPFAGCGPFPVFKFQPAATSTSRPVRHGGSQTTGRERMLRKLAECNIEEVVGYVPQSYPGPCSRLERGHFVFRRGGRLVSVQEGNNQQVERDKQHGGIVRKKIDLDRRQHYQGIQDGTQKIFINFAFTKVVFGSRSRGPQ